MRFKEASSKTQHKYFGAQPCYDKNSGVRLLDCGFSGGQIVPRKGFFTDIYNPVYRSDFSPDTENEFSVTSCALYVDGRYCRVTVAKAENFLGSVELYMKLIFADGEVLDVGSIIFGRVSANQFSYPDTFTVFGGAPTLGCGIYFIVRQVYTGDYEDFVKVMELSENKTEWIMITDSDMYAPTLLANGRGEAYFSAMPKGEYLRLPAPVRCEGRNLLCGRFKAYYTTDSASFGFYLPQKMLDDELISARLKIGSETAEWKIYRGEENSETADLNGTEVIMLCDREEGRIYFKKPDGTDFALPYSPSLNNLCIEASKTLLADKVKVASMNSCCTIESGSKQKGRVTALYGGYLHTATVVLNSPIHPLYFPEDGQYVLGEEEKVITKLLIRDKNLLAIKESEIYAAELKQLVCKSGIVDLSNGAAPSTTTHSLSFIKKAEMPFKAEPQTIGLLGQDLFAVTSDGRLMRISARFSSEEVCELAESGRGFALSDGKRYIFFGDRRASVIEKKYGKLTFAEWTLPGKFIGGFSDGKELLVFSQLAQNGISVIYPVRQKGDCDLVAEMKDDRVEEAVYRIKAEYRIPLFKELHGTFKISRVCVDGDGVGLTASVFGQKGLAERSRALFSDGRATFTCGCLVVFPELAIQFNGAAIKGIAAEYRMINRR